MPIYKVPAERGFGGVGLERKKQQPRVSIPMKPEWLKDLKIGQEVEISVKGKVVNLHMDEDSQRKSSDVSIAVDSTEYYKTKPNEVDKVFDDAEEDS